MSIDRDRPDPPVRWTPPPATAPVVSESARRADVGAAARAASAEQARFERALQRASSDRGPDVRSVAERGSLAAAERPYGTKSSLTGRMPARAGTRHEAPGLHHAGVQRQEAAMSSTRAERQASVARSADPSGDEGGLTERPGVNESREEAPLAGVVFQAAGLGGIPLRDPVHGPVGEYASVMSSDAVVQKISAALADLQLRAVQWQRRQHFELLNAAPGVSSLQLIHDPEQGWEIRLRVRRDTTRHSLWDDPDCTQTLLDALHARGHAVNSLEIVEEP